VIVVWGTCCSSLVIYQQDANEKLSSQQFKGPGPLRLTIRDVNGDGKQELILPPPLPDPGVESFGGVREIIWPHVYRLDNRRYIEASNEFASYYEAQVLPPIEQAISSARERIAYGPIGMRSQCLLISGDTQPICARLTPHSNRQQTDSRNLQADSHKYT
jgi:hypothetical protein